MNKVALISTFCNTDKKRKILLHNIECLKGSGLDVICIGPNFIPIDFEIIKKSDHFIFTKENPVLNWPERACFHWKEVLSPEGNKVRLIHSVMDYGWAALYHVKKLIQFSLKYEYDIFYPMVYDLDIDDLVLNEIFSNITNSFYTRLNPNNPEEVWQSTLHFLSLDRQAAKKIESRITLDNYLLDGNFAEDEVLKWANEFNLVQRQISVKDKIFYFEGIDFFDINFSSDFKFFISKDENPVRVILYDVKNISDKIKIIINKREKIFPVLEGNILSLNILPQEVVSLELIYGGDCINFTEEYKKISRNVIEEK